MELDTKLCSCAEREAEIHPVLCLCITFEDREQMGLGMDVDGHFCILQLHYEREAEVKSEAELSVTESTLYDMSRQASRTESSDGLTETRPSEHVIEQLLQLSVADNTCLQGHDVDRLDQFVDDQGQGDAGDGDIASSVEMNYLKSVVPSDDFPALSRPADFDAAHSRSGSDSTPRSSSTVEGACGGVESSQGQSPCEDLEPEPTGHEAKCSSASSDALCDIAGDVFYAKTACSNSNATAAACSDSGCTALGVPAKVATSCGSQDCVRESDPPHICRVKGSSDTTSEAALPKVWKTCDNKNVLNTSLQDFPALVTGRRNDMVLTRSADFTGAEMHRQETSTVTDSAGV